MSQNSDPARTLWPSHDIQDILLPVFKMACNITISSLLWWISGDGEGTQTWMAG
jgi:hypothetical protein